jgi:hypothetical protein
VFQAKSPPFEAKIREVIFPARAALIGAMDIGFDGMISGSWSGP